MCFSKKFVRPVSFLLFLVPSTSISETLFSELVSPSVSSGVVLYFVHDFCFSQNQTYEQLNGRIVLNPEFVKSEENSYFLKNANIGVSLSQMSLDGKFDNSYPVNCVVMFSATEELSAMKALLSDTVKDVAGSDVSVQGDQEIVKIGQVSVLFGSKLEYRNGETFGYFYSQPVGIGNRLFDQIESLRR